MATEGKGMWALLAIAFVVLAVMALGGSAGARSFLKIVGLIVLLAAAGITLLIYNNQRDKEKRDRERASREAACRAPAASECLYRELSQMKVKIGDAIALLRTRFGDADSAGTKSFLDRTFQSSGYLTVSNDNARKLLVYTLRLRCAEEKQFSFLVNVGFSSDEKSVAYLNTWWKDAEDASEYRRDWKSCISKPAHVNYNNFDSQLSTDYSRLPRPVVVPPEARSVSRGAQLSDDDDPCAVGISTDERLKRLRKFGPVRQTGSETFRAGDHTVVLYGGKNLISCR